MTGWCPPRRSSSSASRTRTGSPLQTRQCGPGGHRRDPAARPGQGEPADAAQPDHRRRGARRGVPRPAARAQRRPARHVHHPRQQRARGAGQDVHAAAARRREHLGALRGADGRRVASTWWSTSASTSAAYAGSTRSSACPAGSRTTSSRPSRSSSGAAASCGAPAGCRRAPSATSGSGIDVHRILAGSLLMGALVGLGVGIGLMLVWAAFFLPRRPRGRAATPARDGRPAGAGRPGRGVGDRASSLLCLRLRSGDRAGHAGRLRHAAGRGRLRR